jgi:hypothetical protein
LRFWTFSCDFTGKKTGIRVSLVRLNRISESQSGDNQFKDQSAINENIALKESFNIPLLTSIYFSPVNIKSVYLQEKVLGVEMA